MRRKGGTALVANEVAVLAAASELEEDGIKSFHGYAMVKAFGDEAAMSTVYRCLSRLESRGLLEGRWEFADEFTRPIRQFSLTKEGRRAAVDQVAPSQPIKASN